MFGSQGTLHALHNESQLDGHESGIPVTAGPHRSTEQALAKGRQTQAGLLGRDPSGGWEAGLSSLGAPGTGTDTAGAR